MSLITLQQRRLSGSVLHDPQLHDSFHRNESSNKILVLVENGQVCSFFQTNRRRRVQDIRSLVLTQKVRFWWNYAI